MLDKKQLDFLIPYSELYTYTYQVMKEINRKEWNTAGMYIRTALGGLLNQIHTIYSVAPEGDLNAKTQILEVANIISPKSKENYDTLRVYGNRGHHIEEQAMNSDIQLNEATVINLYRILLEELMIFVESYAVHNVPDGKNRIIKAQQSILHGVTYKNRVPKGIIRIVSIVHMLIGVGFIFMVGAAEKQFSSMNNSYSDYGIFTIIFMVVGVIAIICGMYEFVSGDDRLIRYGIWHS